MPYGITNNNCNNVVSPFFILYFTLLYFFFQFNPFTLNCFMIPRTCLFIFDAGSRRLGSYNFRNSSYKEKTAGSTRVSRLSSRFLWLWKNEVIHYCTFTERILNRNVLFLSGVFLSSCQDSSPVSIQSAAACKDYTHYHDIMTRFLQQLYLKHICTGNITTLTNQKTGIQ